LVEYTENIWKTEHLRVIVIAVEKWEQWTGELWKGVTYDPDLIWVVDQMIRNLKRSIFIDRNRWKVKSSRKWVHEIWQSGGHYREGSDSHVGPDNTAGQPNSARCSRWWRSRKVRSIYW
jgi:hypothetical protein